MSPETGGLTGSERRRRAEALLHAAREGGTEGVMKHLQQFSQAAQQDLLQALQTLSGNLRASEIENRKNPEAIVLEGPEFVEAIKLTRDLLVNADLDGGMNIDHHLIGVPFRDQILSFTDSERAMHSTLAAVLDKMLQKDAVGSGKYILEKGFVGAVVTHGDQIQLLHDFIRTFIDADQLSELGTARREGGFSLTHAPKEEKVRDPQLAEIVSLILDSLYRAADKALVPYDELRARLQKCRLMDFSPDEDKRRVIDEEFAGNGDGNALEESQPVSRAALGEVDKGTVFHAIRKMAPHFRHLIAQGIEALGQGHRQFDQNYEGRMSSAMLEHLPPPQTTRQRLAQQTLGTLVPNSLADSFHSKAMVSAWMVAYLARAQRRNVSSSTALSQTVFQALNDFGIGSLRHCLLPGLNDTEDPPTPELVTSEVQDLLESIVVFGTLPSRRKHAGAGHALLYEHIHMKEKDKLDISTTIAQDSSSRGPEPTADEHIARIYIAIRRLVSTNKGTNVSVRGMVMQMLGGIHSADIMIRKTAQDPLPLLTKHLEDIAQLVAKHGNEHHAEAVFLNRFITALVQDPEEVWRSEKIMRGMKEFATQYLYPDTEAEDAFIEWYDKRLERSHERKMQDVVFASQESREDDVAVLGSGYKAFADETGAFTVALTRALSETSDQLIGRLADRFDLPLRHEDPDAIPALEAMGMVYSFETARRLMLTCLFSPEAVGQAA